MKLRKIKPCNRKAKYIIVKRTRTKEREIYEMKELLKNENAYNLKMKVNEGTKPKRKRRKRNVMREDELMGYRKSNMNDNPERDRELS